MPAHIIHIDSQLINALRNILSDLLTKALYLAHCALTNDGRIAQRFFADGARMIAPPASMTQKIRVGTGFDRCQLNRGRKRE